MRSRTSSWWRCDSVRRRCRSATSLWRMWRSPRGWIRMFIPSSRSRVGPRRYSPSIECTPCSSPKPIGPSIMSSRRHSSSPSRWRPYLKSTPNDTSTSRSWGGCCGITSWGQWPWLSPSITGTSTSDVYPSTLPFLIILMSLVILILQLKELN